MRLFAAGCWIGLLLAASGCGVRTIAVPETGVLRLRQTVKKVKVWVQDKDGVWVASQADLAEGQYVLSDPGETDAEAVGAPAAGN